MALTPERMRAVDTLTDDELALEVAKAHRSRFQGELYDYATVRLAARRQARDDVAQAAVAAREDERHDEQLVVQGAGVAATQAGTRTMLWVGIAGVVGTLVGAALGVWATLHSAGCH